jgi:hypothetical protein
MQIAQLSAPRSNQMAIHTTATVHVNVNSINAEEREAERGLLLLIESGMTWVHFVHWTFQLRNSRYGLLSLPSGRLDLTSLCHWTEARGQGGGQRCSPIALETHD